MLNRSSVAGEFRGGDERVRLALVEVAKEEMLMINSSFPTPQLVFPIDIVYYIRYLPQPSLSGIVSDTYVVCFRRLTSCSVTLANTPDSARPTPIHMCPARPNYYGLGILHLD